jgi:hypothetical protein
LQSRRHSIGDAECSELGFLISAAWIMSWAIYLTMYGLKAGYAGNTDFEAIPILLLAPPVALWLFALATGWAFRGFRAN